VRSCGSPTTIKRRFLGFDGGHKTLSIPEQEIGNIRESAGAVRDDGSGDSLERSTGWSQQPEVTRRLKNRETGPGD
jgi:hypothetical protein